MRPHPTTGLPPIGQQKLDGSCPYDSGTEVLRTMGMNQTQEECFWILLLMYGVLRVWAFMMLVQVTSRIAIDEGVLPLRASFH